MENYENIDIKRILEIVFSKKILIILILVLSIILGYAYSYYYKKPQYNSSVKILLVADESKEDKEVTQADLTINSGLISTYSSIAKSTNVISKTIQNLGLNMSASELQKNIEVSRINSTQFLKISVKNSNPEIARDIANELAQVFSSQIKQIYNLENIKVVDEAEVANQPCNINHTKDILMFAFVGVFMSVMLVIVIYFFDDTIKDEKDIERNIRLKNIGTLPIKKENSELVIETNPKSYIVECLKTIRTNILYATDKKTILVTSGRQNEGKSWIINNMAIAFAQTNKKVILVDTNLREQSNKNEIFDIEKREGLSDFIKDISDDKLENLKKSQKYIQETKIPNLHILQNGTIPPNPSELISSNNMAKLLDLLKSMYDFVLLDGTSCLLVSDSIALSSMVDNTILVAESKKTKISDLKKTKKLIEDVNGHILGVISNKNEIQGRKYYGKKYGYYSLEEKDELEKVEEKQTSFSLEEVIKMAEENIKQELLNKNEDDYIIEEDNNLQEENKQVDYEIRNVRHDINNLKEIQSSNNRKLLEKIENMNYDKRLEEISEKIKSMNYEEKFEEINEKIENINQEERLEQISKKIENINHEEKFEEINNKLINDREEYLRKLEELKEKDEENIEIMMKKFMEEVSNSNSQIQNLKEIQVNSNLELLEKIKTMNYEERLEEINEKIKNMNQEERLEQISKKIENINHEEKFKEINNKLINDREEYLRKLEELKEKDEENIEIMMKKFMEEVSNSNNQIQNLKEIQVDNNTELLEKIKNMNYEERLEEINEKINNINYEERLEEINEKINNINYEERLEEINKKINNMDQEERLEQISKKIENINHEEKFEEINNKLINDREEYSRKLEELKEKDEENLTIMMKKFMQEVDNLNSQIQSLKELQLNSNTELLERIEKMNYEERLQEINEKIKENKIKDTSNIISFESLKERRKKALKKNFQIDENINYEDLEKLSTCVVDLNEEISAIIAMSN